MLLPGDRLTHDILIDFEIHWQFVILLSIICSAGHTEISHTSPLCISRDVCKLYVISWAYFEPEHSNFNQI